MINVLSLFITATHCFLPWLLLSPVISSAHTFRDSIRICALRSGVSSGSPKSLHASKKVGVLHFRDSKQLIVKLPVVPQLNNLEKAVAAAHTFLKKNPNDPSLTKNMNYYKTLFEVEEYLIDHEEQPYEVCILMPSSALVCKLNQC